MHTLQARVQGKGGKGPAPPPRNWKAKKNVTFLVENIIFSAVFWAGGGGPEKLKSKKKKDFGPPPPLTNSWTRACTAPIFRDLKIL